VIEEVFVAGFHASFHGRERLNDIRWICLLHLFAQRQASEGGCCESSSIEDFKAPIRFAAECANIRFDQDAPIGGARCEQGDLIGGGPHRGTILALKAPQYRGNDDCIQGEREDHLSSKTSRGTTATASTEGQGEEVWFGVPLACTMLIRSYIGRNSKQVSYGIEGLNGNAWGDRIGLSRRLRLVVV
jgi:hypothetical protein